MSFQLRTNSVALNAFIPVYASSPPYSIPLTPALCVSQERWPFTGLEFLRCGITKPRAVFFENGSQRGVTDITASRPTAYCRLPNATLASPQTDHSDDAQQSSL
ncbi:hypothetical protein Pla144_49850 [Bythopirellula polymerisocia]|uniref:Uncharacterized protein n=1 Tax=Bythopirellula polymerisocia TaxID=2528003 RepID=A0A5C6C845_9BACT|nr:hypothetical protein Pla144_49850 [Bythopirellula polymerisocia]